MKVLLSLLLLFVVAAAGVGVSNHAHVIPLANRLTVLLHGAEDDATIQSFVDFAAEYRKAYSSEEEMMYRLKVFKAGVAKAKELDAESRRIGSTARFGITEFSDLTQDEFESG